MTTEHTPLWYAAADGDRYAIGTGDYEMATVATRAEAARIVACVNALAGVPIEALESLVQHQRRQDSLATVARVLGTLDHLGDAAAVAAARAVSP